MLDLLEKIAEEQTGSKAQAQAFISGFVKEASMWSALGKLPGEVNKLGPAVQKELLGTLFKTGIGLAGGITAVALAKGVNTASSSLTNSRLRAKFEQALAQLKTSNKVIRSTKEDKVNAIAETIFRFAPNVASDANVLGPILSSALLGEGLDPMTVKNLVDLEGRYMANNNTTNFVSFPK